MKFTPCCPDGDTDPAIRAAVRRTLAACDVVQPPTRIEELLEYRRLTTAEQLQVEPNLLVHAVKRVSARLWNKLRRKVAGILDLRERHIAINPDLHRMRRSFLKFHEVGHDVLPWHRELFVVTSESDLSMSVREKFEAEANCFAGHAIFQNDHMASGYRGKRLRMAELVGVAAEYRASLTSTARQYVAIQDIPAALIVGYPYGRLGARGIRFQYAIANDAFLREFGNTVPGERFEPEHASSVLLNQRGITISEAEVQVFDLRSESRILRMETMYNSYCTLTLVHPEGRRRGLFRWQPLSALRANPLIVRPRRPS